MATQTLDQQIADYTSKVAATTAAIAKSNSDYNAYWNSYKSFAAANDWDTAYRKKAQAQAQQNDTASLQAQLTIYNQVLQAFQDQKAAATQSTTAANAQMNAAAAVTAAEANLSPDQLLTLQQTQIAAATQASADKTRQAQSAADQATADAAAAAAAASTKKTYIMIGAAIGLVVIIALVWKFSKK